MPLAPEGDLPDDPGPMAERFQRFLPMVVRVVTLCVTLACGAGACLAGARPNILFILIDDMGWMDLGCQGNRHVRTPNIDRLAEEGLRFTDAYAPAPVCSLWSAFL